MRRSLRLAAVLLLALLTLLEAQEVQQAQDNGQGTKERVSKQEGKTTPSQAVGKDAKLDVRQDTDELPRVDPPDHGTTESDVNVNDASNNDGMKNDIKDTKADYDHEEGLDDVDFQYEKTTLAPSMEELQEDDKEDEGPPSYSDQERSQKEREVNLDDEEDAIVEVEAEDVEELERDVDKQSLPASFNDLDETHRKENSEIKEQESQETDVEKPDIATTEATTTQQPEGTPVPRKAETKPNIIIFLADDAGIGDFGCYGNDTMKTPNIDTLASQGVKLTQHLAAASVCTPSRAAMLTGRYPIRSGMAPSNIVRVNIFVSSTGGLPSSEITIAELAKEQGYATAWIGKWHLGVHCGKQDFCHHPNRQGFDHFYGLPLTNLQDFGDDGRTVTKSRVPFIDYYLALACVLGVATALLFRKSLGLVLTLLLIFLSVFIPALAYWTYTNMTLLNAVLMRNQVVVEQPLRLKNRLAARLVDEASEFINKQAKTDTPFLLVVGWVQVHTALHSSPEFTGVSKHGRYGDNLEEMDWSVGQVLNTLTRNNLEDDTLVYFASDNGAHSEERAPDGQREGGSNGIYRGGKAMGGMEGGVRVPGVVKFPGRLPAGRVVDQAVSMMDLYPTLASLMGASVPTDRDVDGQDVLPLLKGTSDTPPHEYLFHYCGVSLQAARYTPDDGTNNVWKVHFATPNWLPGTETCPYICGCYGGDVIWHDPPLLYNLATDPSESTLLNAADPKYKPIVDKVNAAVEVHRASLGPVEDQMAPLKLVPRPSLQPCCGTGSFPNCDCSEPPFP